MSDDPILPDWVAELRVRKMLWRDYGVAQDDMTYTDAVHAMRLELAETRRNNEIAKRNQGS